MMATPRTDPTSAPLAPALESLLALQRRLDGERSAEGMFRAVDDALAEVIAFDRIAIGRRNAVSNRITIEYERGLSLGYPSRYEALPPDSSSLIHPVVVGGRSIRHTVPDDHDVFRGDPVRRRHGVRQAIVTPITADGAVTGIVTINSIAADTFTDETTTIVEMASRLLGLALSARETRSAEMVLAGEALADTLTRMAFASSLPDVVDALYHGIETATGACAIRFARRERGGYRFVDAHHGCSVASPQHDVASIGAALAPRLAGFVDADVGGGAVPQRQIFTDLPLGDGAPAVVRSLDTIGVDIDADLVAVTPIHAAREVLGLLVGVWPDAGPPERIVDHLGYLFRFGDVAGPALHRLILMQRLEQRIAETETVRRLTESIARTPRYQDALDIITRTAQMLTGLDMVAVVEIAADYIIWRSASGARDTSFLNRRLPVPPRVLSEILESHQEVVLDDVRSDPEFTPDLMPVHIAEGLRSTVVVPVHVNARLRAAMIFASRRLRDFPAEEITMQHALAATVATALASADARVRDGVET